MIRLQDLVTTNLFYVAAKGSENLLSGIIIWERGNGLDIRGSISGK